MSMFAATQNKPSLFGSTSTNQPQQNASSVFGSFGQSNNTTAQTGQQNQTSSLFGAPAQQQQSTTASPFGTLGQQQQPAGGGLFGSTQQQQQQQPSGGGGLFGSTQQQQQPSGGGLLGSTQQQPSGGGLFGSTQQQQQQPSGAGLFGSTQQQQQTRGGGLFGSTQQQPQQNTGGLFGNSQSQQQPNGSSTYGAAQSQYLQPALISRPPVWQPGTSLSPREKNIPEQMQTILEKWSPESSSCLFQRYFYNDVPPETVPYYTPGPGEDEQKWEEALANKPREGSIPVLCRGFTALGKRLGIQVQSANALQARMHEINVSLTAILQSHDLDISVRAVDARRRHVAMSQRCLQLAAKVQILRNRGYAMDGAEEKLKNKLTALEREAFDPQLSGRQEEIWARMVGVRQRARLLIEEAEKSGRGTQDQGEAFDEDIMRKTKKILTDYDSQISHLRREIDDIRKDFDSWEGSPAAERAKA